MQTDTQRYPQFEKMKKNRRILSCFRVISNTVRKIADIHLMEKNPDMSEMSACILLYLEQQEQKRKAVFHRDLEWEFHISKATVSQIISRMEKKKMVKRIGDTDDTRIKWIVMTDYGRNMLPFLKAADKQFADRIMEGFSEEEKEILLGFLKRIQDNLYNLDEKERRNA